jgi:hypothetical protein
VTIAVTETFVVTTTPTAVPEAPATTLRESLPPHEK